MSLTIKMVREWITSNDLYSADFDVATYVTQGKDIFVPSENKYPHVHISKNFIVWSKSSGNHTDLFRGDKGYKQNIDNALVTAKDFGVNQLLRYMSSQS